MAHVIIFDTETTSLDRPFCYDTGYTILNTENQEIVKQEHYVIEQIWHNLPLFESAYYKDKRPIYIQLMRAHKATMEKWGYVMRNITRDIKTYSIKDAYAYNSDFDDKVFAFNCNWFRCNNPFETVAIHDIWGYASEYITKTDSYKLFCEQHKRFTDTGNYKGSAEVVYQFITNNPDFVEQHMGLYDGQIESSILIYCINHGAKWDTDYPVNKILPRRQIKPFTIKIDGQTIYSGEYVKKYTRNDTYSFTTTKGQ